MKRILTIGWMLIFFFIITITAINAQTSLSVAQYLAYNSNSFYNYKQLPDFSDQIIFSASHIFEGEKVQSQIYYQGDLNFFKTYSERLYHVQMLGYDGYLLDSALKQTIYFGANWQWHDGQEIYNSYDFWKQQGYASSKFYFRPNLIGKFGYQLSNRNYTELPEFSYWEHYLYAQFNTFFQTGTSFTLFFNYGFKNYLPVQISSSRRNPQFIEMPSVDQFVSSLKISQSLGAKTSISFFYLNRVNPGLASGSASVINTENLFTENELFDDRYGYNGHEISLQLIRYLPGYFKLELAATQYWKNYLNRQIYDLAGNSSLAENTRKDLRSLFWASLSRSFAFNYRLKNMTVILSGGFLKNNSNDRYYQFDNAFGSLGLQFKIK